MRGRCSLRRFRLPIFSLEEITDEQLGEYLVELGHLNRWQSEQLRQGRTKFNLGSYRIVDAIGHGGMGWVFKGEHELLGRVEAIKVLPNTQTNPISINELSPRDSCSSATGSSEPGSTVLCGL